MFEDDRSSFISGNLKKHIPGNTTNVRMYIPTKAKFLKEAEKEGMNHVNYLDLVLEHYWECENKYID